MNPLLQFFSWSHLPIHLQTISQPFGRLALDIDAVLPENAEKDMMFRKLIEAKDCAVRAQLLKSKGENSNDAKR